MKRFIRVLVVVVLVGVAVVIGSGCSTIRPLLHYASYRIAPDFPKDESKTINIDGLNEPVTVYLDEAGIAHIEAANEIDLARAAGFIQARSRFFEMDMLRRLARGRVAELVGEQPFVSGTTLDFDKSMRAWGIEDAAEIDAKDLDADAQELMDAYTAGVNAALDRYTPFEYGMIGVEPEPWTVSDSFAVGRFNAWTVCHNWHQELSRLVIALHGGLDRADAIYPSEPWDGYASLPGNAPKHELPPAIAPELREAFVEQPEVAAAGVSVGARIAIEVASWMSASNSWVAGGDWTASGKPLVAGDPHLPHFLPSIFFQMHLKAPGLDVIGVTIPGLPFILAGHNEHVTFNVTAANADVMDLYLEWPNPDAPNEVKTPDGWKALEVEEEVFKVRDGSKLREVTHPVRHTRHGPLINDIYPGVLPKGAWPVAVRWLDEGAGRAIAAGFKANKAKSVEELRIAMSDYSTPPSIWTAADTNGNIALFPTGAVPVRQHHRGTFPAPGWLAKYDWEGTVPNLELPHGVAGPEGIFAHSNNLLTPPDESAFLYQSDSAPSYRVERVVQMIRERKDHDFESFARIQRDTYLRRAEAITPHMLADLESAEWTGMEAEALSLLQDWDYDAPADEPAPAVFHALYLQAVLIALMDEADEAGANFVLSQRYSSNAYDRWFADTENPAWDNVGTEQVETRSDVMAAAFPRAVAWLQNKLGDDPGAWQWGQLHDLQMNHVFGGIALLADFVNLPPSELGGGPGSVWKTHFDLSNTEHPFRIAAGPALRTIADLNDLQHARWIIDTGNSGWPGSPNYGDQYERWRKGEHLDMVSDWDDVKANAKAVLTLAP